MMTRVFSVERDSFVLYETEFSFVYYSPKRPRDNFKQEKAMRHQRKQERDGRREQGRGWL